MDYWRHWLLTVKGVRNIEINPFRYFQRRNEEADVIKEIDLLLEDFHDIELQEYAVNVAIGMISRSLSMVEWRVKNGDDYVKDITYRRLNVKPNPNQSASEFWGEFVRRLFYESGEVLVILLEGNMYIAEDWDRHEFAVKPEYFTNVTIKNQTFDKRPFYIEDCLYINLRNYQIKRIIRALDETYAKMFNRLVQVAMRTNQVRGTAKISGTLAAKEGGSDLIQNFINKIYKAYQNNSVAIVPEQDGLEYKEHSRDTTNRSVVGDAITAGNAYLNKVLIACGIHPSLVYGDMADTSLHWNRFLLNVINPLAKMIENEINAKMFTDKEYLEGQYVEYANIRTEHTNIFDVAPQVEKLVGSNAFTPNEVREQTGYEASDAEGMDEFYLTKNIEQHRVDSTEEENA